MQRWMFESQGILGGVNGGYGGVNYGGGDNCYEGLCDNVVRRTVRMRAGPASVCRNGRVIATLSIFSCS